MSTFEESPLCTEEKAQTPRTGARRGHRFWIAAPIALMVVVGITFVLQSRRDGQDSSFTDAISESSYVQTRSYKCNMKHEEALSRCESAGNQTNATEGRRLTESAPDADSGATTGQLSSEICKEGAYLDYKACCDAMPSKRCSFPCSEVCQQKFGIMTSDYKECCTVCPGGTCVDPWRLLDEFW